MGGRFEGVEQAGRPGDLRPGAGTAPAVAVDGQAQAMQPAHEGRAAADAGAGPQARASMSRISVPGHRPGPRPEHRRRHTGTLTHPDRAAP